MPSRKFVSGMHPMATTPGGKMVTL